MIQIVLIGLGAGAASALLFASVVSGSPLSFLLANFAQLPIMIAAVGWTHFAGLTAVVLASAGLAILFGGWIAFAFLIGIGLPAWWLGYLALLGRSSSDGAAVEWYPVGHIVVWSAIAAAAIVIVSMMRYGVDVASMQSGLRRELEHAMRFLTGTPADGPLQLPGVKDADRLLDVLVLVVPPMKAIALTLISLFNLWLAAWAVKISGRLRRPWPSIAGMTFPRFAPMVFAAAGAATFLPDLVGLIGTVLSASLLLAYALLGFAVVHSATIGIGGRGFMLTGMYLIVVLFGWPILLMSLLGLIETMTSLRARIAARRPPPTAPLNRT
jgi:Predicted membrane protein (DUF2232)